MEQSISVMPFIVTYELGYQTMLDINVDLCDKDNYIDM